MDAVLLGADYDFPGLTMGKPEVSRIEENPAMTRLRRVRS